MRKMLMLSLLFCISLTLKVSASPPVPDVGTELVVDDGKSFTVQTDVLNFYALPQLEYFDAPVILKAALFIAPGTEVKNLNIVNPIEAYADNPVRCPERYYSTTILKDKKFSKSEKLYLNHCAIRQCTGEAVAAV